MRENKQAIRKSSRAVIAFAAGPAVASGAVAVLFLVLGLLLGAHGDELAILVGGLFGGMMVLGYLVSIILGIPSYLLFRRWGWIGRRHWFLLGAAIGALSGTLFMIVGLANPNSAESQARNVISAGVVIALVSAGATGAMFAWLIRSKGPNLDEVAATFD